MKRRLVRVLLSLLCLTALPALGSVVVGLSIEDMTRAAPLVVRGRVGSVQVAWDEGKRKIWTRAEIQVTEALKGKPAATIIVRQPGGEILEENIGQRVEGVAQFKSGEEGLFFLETVPDESDVFTVFALAAGKVNFEKSKVGELRAVRHLEGLAFYALPSNKVVLPVGNIDDLGGVDAFVKRVKKALGGAR